MIVARISITDAQLERAAKVLEATEANFEQATELRKIAGQSMADWVEKTVYSKLVDQENWT